MKERFYRGGKMKKIKWVILHIEEIIASTALAIMMCAIFFNVIMRYCFRSPTSWTDELAVICLAYVTFVGGAAAYKRNLHFGIDIILDKLPARIRMLVRQITNSIFAVMFIFVTYLGYDLFRNAVKVFNYSGWSYKIMDAALPLGFLSMSIYAVYFFIQSFRDKDAYIKRYENTYEEETVDQNLIEASQEIFSRDRVEKGEDRT